MHRYETTDLLNDTLEIKDKGVYKDAAVIVIPFVPAGTIVSVYGESHGDPRQKDRTKQKECAWVTGISVDGVGDVCKRRGRDLYYAQKDYDCRYGTFEVLEDTTDLTIRYEQRAINKYTGGQFNISWVKLGALVHTPITVTEPEPEVEPEPTENCCNV